MRPVSLTPGSGAVPSVPQTQPKSLFRYGEQTIWSTQLFGSGTAIANSENRIFSTPRGQQGQGFTNALSTAETNLKIGGQVPAGIAYDVYGVAGQILLSDNTADTGDLTQQANTAALVDEMQNLVNNCTLKWDFSQTTVDIAPLNLCGAGGGLYGALAGAGGATANEFIGTVNNGSGNIFMYRKHPVALPGQSVFAIIAGIGSRAAAIGNGNSVALRIVLLGFYKNVIEIG